MGMPAKLKNINLFANSTSYIGLVKEVTIPKLVVKTEEWRGGGMLGPILIDVGLDKQEVDFTIGGLVADLLRRFGSVTHDSELLRFAGAYQDSSTGQVQAFEMTALGRFTEIDFGNAQAGSDSEHKYKMPCSYNKIDINGVNIVEIDMLAGIFIVDGVDRYADIRAAIGA